MPYHNPFEVSSDVLDAMTNSEYEKYQWCYREYHYKHYPSTCIYVPRRMTPEERAKERQKIDEYMNTHGEIVQARVISENPLTIEIPCKPLVEVN
jgi:hypothetical protein